MPSNTARIARTRKELSADVVETVPPWKRKNSKKIGSKYVFDQHVFDRFLFIIIALTAMADTPQSQGRALKQPIPLASNII